MYAYIILYYKRSSALSAVYIMRRASIFRIYMYNACDGFGFLTIPRAYHRHVRDLRATAHTHILLYHRTSACVCVWVCSSQRTRPIERVNHVHARVSDFPSARESVAPSRAAHAPKTARQHHSRRSGVVVVGIVNFFAAICPRTRALARSRAFPSKQPPQYFARPPRPAVMRVLLVCAGINVFDFQLCGHTTACVLYARGLCGGMEATHAITNRTTVAAAHSAHVRRFPSGALRFPDRRSAVVEIRDDDRVQSVWLETWWKTVGAATRLRIHADLSSHHIYKACEPVRYHHQHVCNWGVCSCVCVWLCENE